MGCFFLSIAFANLMAQQVAKYFINVQEKQTFGIGFTKFNGFKRFWKHF